MTSQLVSFSLRCLLFVGLSIALVACDSNSDNREPIRGDLSYRVEGAAGTTFNRSTNYHTEQNIESESSTETIPNDGVFTGDLRDGVVGIEVSIRQAGDATLFLTLDGRDVDETETNANGSALVTFGDLFGASPL